jgi:hypothetical protein
MKYIQDLIHIKEWEKPISDYKPPKTIRFYTSTPDPLYLAGMLR